MNNPDRIKPIILGTMTMIILSVIPILSLINIFCCAGIVLGGVVGVASYNKQLKSTNVKLLYKDGVIIGILCGILSAVVVTGVNLLTQMYSKVNPFIEIKSLLESFTNIIPEISNEIDRLAEEYNIYGYSPTLTIFMALTHIILYPLFGILGGILMVTILNKKNKNV
jgi:hypothetical protein